MKKKMNELFLNKLLLLNVRLSTWNEISAVTITEEFFEHGSTKTNKIINF